MNAPEFAAVEAALAQKGLSVARLCRRAEVAESTWGRLKTGRNRGRQATLAQLRIAFKDLTGQDWPAAERAEAA